MRIYILRYKSMLVAGGDEIPHELTLSLRRYHAIKCLSTRTSSVVMLSWRLVDARLQAMYLAPTGRSVGSNMLREC
jgi:hypothetical protein